MPVPSILELWKTSAAMKKSCTDSKYNSKEVIFMKMTQTGIVVIGIDHGYGNIKTANTITPTGVTAYDTKPAFEGNILFYDNTYYKIGDVHKTYIPDKSEDIDNYICTLYGIARELSREDITEADVHISAGLPLAWVREQRESFRKYLLKHEYAVFDFKDKHYKVHIVGCSVYPQGYTAVIDRLHDMNGVNLIADIGNGTMNVMYLNNKRANESRCWTEKLGVSKCVDMVKNAVMDKYHVVLDDAIIEEVIRRGTADIAPHILETVTRTMADYCKLIFDTLRKYDYDPDLMKLYIVGGGSVLIKNFGNYKSDRVILITDVCATVKGYEFLAWQSLNKR